MLKQMLKQRHSLCMSSIKVVGTLLNAQHKLSQLLCPNTCDIPFDGWGKRVNLREFG